MDLGQPISPGSQDLEEVVHEIVPLRMVEEMQSMMQAIWGPAGFGIKLLLDLLLHTVNEAAEPPPEKLVASPASGLPPATELGRQLAGSS